MNANAIVIDGLKHLGVIAVGETPTAEDVSEGLGALNAMVRTWESEGIALGWNEPGLFDEIPTPELAEALGFVLATKLAGKYGITLAPSTVAGAADGMNSIRAYSMRKQFSRLRYDDLPVGVSGRCGDFFNS